LTRLECGIVLVAAGASTRMGFAKLWSEVHGQPLIARALRTAVTADAREIVVVVSADRVAQTARLAPYARVVAGGPRRRDSVAAGVGVASAEWLAIHDAARVLAPTELFERGLTAARASGAAIPGLPLKDTIKRVADGHVVDTPARAEHIAVQTPQVFRRDVLERALALTDQDVTDEAALVEGLGIRVAVFQGDEHAFKVTTPLDLALVRALLAEEGAAKV
jgi:2-C-methyl-D-erythritol 4-phosphate cytidylyltransferase